MNPKPAIACRLCGEPVELSPRRYVEYIKAGEQPVCRRNGCHRIARYACERLGEEEKAASARRSQGAVRTAVASKVYAFGTGRRGHHAAPLANGVVAPLLDGS